MAHVVVLVQNSEEEVRLRKTLSVQALGEEHRIVWCETLAVMFRYLAQHIVDGVIVPLQMNDGRPLTPVIARIARRFPVVTIYVYVAAAASARASAHIVFQTGRAGAHHFIGVPGDGTLALRIQREANRQRTRFAHRVFAVLGDRFPSHVTEFLDGVLRHPERGAHIADLARLYGVTPSCLARRCRRAGLPVPRTLVEWMQLLVGLHYLQQPGLALTAIDPGLGEPQGTFQRLAHRHLGMTGAVCQAPTIVDWCLHVFRRTLVQRQRPELPAGPVRSATAPGVRQVWRRRYYSTQ